MFKTIGIYALIITGIDILVFIRAFLPGGGYEIFLLSYSISFFAILISIVGVIFDKKKTIPKISLVLSIIPLIFMAYSYLS